MCCEFCTVLSASAEASSRSPTLTMLADNGEAAKSNPTHQHWEANKNFIWYLYIEKGATLKEVQAALNLTGFDATGRMFKSRLESWGFVKNASRKDWLAAALLWNSQKAAGLPLTNILIHEKMKSPADYKRYLREQKHPLTEKDFLEEALQEKMDAPPHVRFAEPDDGQKPFDETLYVTASSLGIRGGVQPQSVGNPLPPCASCHGTNAEMMMGDRNEVPLLSARPSMPFTKPIFDLGYHLDNISEPPRNPQLGCTMEQTYGAAGYLSQMGHSITLPLTNDAENADTSLVQARKKRKVDGVASETPDEIHQIHSIIRINEMLPKPLTNRNAQPSVNSVIASGSQRNANDLDRNENEATRFLAACICVLPSGALGRSDVLKFGLKQVAASVHTMCHSTNPLLLLTIDTVMVFLRVHAEGSLPESLLRAIYHIAVGVMGENDPISRCIEWMMAAAGGNLHDQGIDSNALEDICNSISQVYGETHSYSLVAAYCLAFQLLLEGACSKAEAQLLALHDRAVAVLGPNALLTVNTLATLSRAQTRQGHHEAALDTMNRCLLLTPLGTPLRLNNLHRFELLYRKALICKKLGHIDDMLECLYAVVEGRAAALGTYHPSTQKAHNSLVEALQEFKMWESDKGRAHRVLYSPQVDLTEQEDP